jgi:hypothetical protein
MWIAFVLIALALAVVLTWLGHRYSVPNRLSRQRKMESDSSESGPRA